jgi:rhodanese-related sulfurtransferase
MYSLNRKVDLKIINSPKGEQIMKYNAVKAKEYFEDKMAFTTSPFGLSQKIGAKEDVNIIDVRAQEDYAKGHIPGAINLPSDMWHTLEGLKKDTINIVYCYDQTCHLAAAAAVEFTSKGYPVMEMEGGFATWQGKGYAVGKKEHSGIRCLC